MISAPDAGSLRQRARRYLEHPLQITVTKKSLFLILIGVAVFWILLDTVGRGHDRTADGGGYGSYLSTDYDLEGCPAVPLPERIRDLQRILLSVRAEVVESSARLDGIIKQFEEISHQIQEKQNELARVQAEIESARSLLRDLKDRRNVRVSLPGRPLLPSNTLVRPRGNGAESEATAAAAFEDLIDYSRCSLTTPLRVYLYPTARGNALYESIAGSPYAEPDPKAACLFVVVVTDEGKMDLQGLPYWQEDGGNHVVLNTGKTSIGVNASTTRAIVVQSVFESGAFRRGVDFALPLESLRRRAIDDWKALPQLLPYSRRNLVTLVVRSRWRGYERDVASMEKSMRESEDEWRIVECAGGEKKEEEGLKCEKEIRDALSLSHFALLMPSPSGGGFMLDLLSALQSGAIPVVMRVDAPLPFEDTLDWSRALFRLPSARLAEAHFRLRDVAPADVLEMRRRGRRILEAYLGSTEALWWTLGASLSERLSLPPRSAAPHPAPPLFANGTALSPPIQTPVNQPVYSDDEYLGPLEAQFDSPQFLHNFTSIGMYGYDRWNERFSVGGTAEYSIGSAEMPNGAEFMEDTAAGFRPIEPGSGKEFSLALGGNRQREQFTVVMLTYNRDAVLAASLERLHKCPYLNKVIVIWNNVDREPQGAWPRLHVPVEFIRAERNSLNNRFIPWDRIRTEAVLSLDDDIDLKQHEIVFAFRVWRENRRKLVGFPARQHSRFGSDLFYNSNHTCQLSMILTGAAFIHKSYLYAYTYEMPEAIREHVDKVTNCEDLAMNFLVAHLTREPPLKTTSKWTLRCPTCTESLWSDGDHFNERHECIRLLTKIYGYNPLRYSQYRADSILFKTRIPSEMQKCFRYV